MLPDHIFGKSNKCMSRLNSTAKCLELRDNHGLLMPISALHRPTLLKHVYAEIPLGYSSSRRLCSTSNNSVHAGGALEPHTVGRSDRLKSNPIVL